MSSSDKPHHPTNKSFNRGRGGGSFRGGSSERGGGNFRGGSSGRGRGSFNRGGETRPGGYSKTGKVYEGKREKLKARRNYASKVKSDYAKQLHHLDTKDDFTKTPDFYQEIFAEVDRENAKKPQKSKPSFDSKSSSHASSEQSDSDSESPSDASFKQNSEAPSEEDEPEESKSSVVEHKPKPNPFKRSIEELEKQQQELDAIRKEAKLAKEKAIKDKIAKKRQRKVQTTKLLRRTKSGQPILADHLDHILKPLASRFKYGKYLPEFNYRITFNLISDKKAKI